MAALSDEASVKYFNLIWASRRVGVAGETSSHGPEETVLIC